MRVLKTTSHAFSPLAALYTELPYASLKKSECSYIGTIVAGDPMFKNCIERILSRRPPATGSLMHESEQRTPEEWKRRRREAREARRAAQRIANVGRAAEMNRQRLAYERGTLELPAVSCRKVSKDRPFVGCSGWYYWHWKDMFYPASIARNRWFEHYARNFRTVELNAPFYAWPTIGTVRQWLRQAAGKNFVYTVKVSELITHVKRFSGTKRLVKDFGLIADLLGPQFGCFLFQLPPSFHYTTARLRHIVEQLDPQRTNVVEFRHPSWWNSDVFRAFRKAKICFCSCSGPRLPDGLVKTADDVYVRFHGTKKWYRHDYSRDELAIWAERIRTSGAKRVWAYFNNDRDAYAIKNAKTLVSMLRRRSR